MMSKNTIFLDYPIEASGVKVKSLTFRRATVADLLTSSHHLYAQLPDDKTLTNFFRRES